jgi:antitoxin component of MazEF toxin-antitoxin module
MIATIKTLDNGNKFIEIPDELMIELGWEQGDDIQWRRHDDGCINITKANKLDVSQNRIDSLIGSGWTIEQVETMLEIAGRRDKTSL